MGEGK